MNLVLQQWLLNLALDCPISFRLLPPILDGRDETPHALNVRSLRGFSLDIAVKRLVELAEDGLIKFTRTNERLESQAITLSEVLALVSSGAAHGVSFELTDAGGEAWEKAAQPHWSEMDDGFALVSEENAETLRLDWTYLSQSRDRLMAVLGWFHDISSGDQIDLRSVRWQLHDAYQVRYWKNLPNVHVVTFRAWTRAESSLRYAALGEGLSFRDEPWFETWFSSRSDWYRKPWDLEGWPPAPEED